MIEPTDEMEQAAMVAADEAGFGLTRQAARDVAAAVLAIVERDYVVRPATRRVNERRRAASCDRCPKCGQEDVDGVRWVDMVDQCVADFCPARDGTS